MSDKSILPGVCMYVLGDVYACVCLYSTFCLQHGCLLPPEKLKFTPTPQPSQCLELDKEGTVPCSAKGREIPTVQWTKAGGCSRTSLYVCV